MKPSIPFLGFVLLAAQHVLGLEFTYEAKHNGKPLPKSKMKMVKSDMRTGPPVRMNKPTGPVNARKLDKRGPNERKYSNNWCGAVNRVPLNNPIQVLHTFWNHPHCTAREGERYPQALAAWGGIDGNSAPTLGLLQAGTVCKLWEDGSITHEAWWEWIPEPPYHLDTRMMPVAPDDIFELTISMENNHTGLVELVNLSQGYYFGIKLVNGPAMARVDADFVVEIPGYGDRPAGTPHFSPVFFQESWGKLANGGLVGIEGAIQYQMHQRCESVDYNNETSVSWPPV
ncbi:concanavalin A-like lectin/glucanase domain-containing protein [Podospora conica]|nr:concanavalin A-like lectin/glucanase domain-containing protein [Schizothecium conicum]